MNRSMPGLPVHHQLLKLTQTHANWVGDAIQPSHPLSHPSPPAPNPSQHQGLFQWVNSLHEVAKVLEFQLQHQSFQLRLTTHKKFSSPLDSLSYFHSISAQSSRILSQTTKVCRQSGIKQVNICKWTQKCWKKNTNENISWFLSLFYGLYLFWQKALKSHSCMYFWKWCLMILQKCEQRRCTTWFNSMKKANGHSLYHFHRNTPNILTEGGWAEEMAGQLQWLQICAATFTLQRCSNYVSKKCYMQASSFLFQSCCLFRVILTHTLMHGIILYVIPHNMALLPNPHRSNGIFKRSFHTFFYFGQNAVSL